MRTTRFSRPATRILTVALAALTIAAAHGEAWAQSTSRADVASEDRLPRDGVLLLKNGQILAGRITWSGDHCFVSRDGLQVGVRATEVEAIANDLDDAYRRKRAKLNADDLDGHQSLAEWCLRHELLGSAAAEIAECLALNERNTRTRTLMERLQSSRRMAEADRSSPVTKGKTPSTAKSAAEQAAADGSNAKDVQVDGAAEPAKNHEKTSVDGKAARSSGAKKADILGDVSPEVAETFVTTIQPMLINHCGMGGCHGGASAAKMQLTRFDPRRNPSRAYTQRNLAAVLKQIDHEHPDSSPLSVMPGRPHGTAKSAVFDNRTAQQYRQLVYWVQRASGAARNDGESQSLADAQTDIADQNRDAVDAPFDANGSPVSKSAAHGAKTPTGRTLKGPSVNAHERAGPPARGPRKPTPAAVGQVKHADAPGKKNAVRTAKTTVKSPAPHVDEPLASQLPAADDFNRRYFPNGKPNSERDDQITAEPKYPTPAAKNNSTQGEPDSVADSRPENKKPARRALKENEIPPFENIEEGEVARKPMP